jgi:hypothetical protein
MSVPVPRSELGRTADLLFGRPLWVPETLLHDLGWLIAPGIDRGSPDGMGFALVFLSCA